MFINDVHCQTNETHFVMTANVNVSSVNKSDRHLIIAGCT